MKPTQEQVIAWAREAELFATTRILIRFAALAYEAGQESMKWDGIHSCHPDCQRPACVHTRKTYQEGYEAGRKDENEACAAIAALILKMPENDVCAVIRARRQE